MTHDYNRHGTTTLFAAFNVLDGVVLGRCMQKHTHQEFIASQRRRTRGPCCKLIHAIVDNYATTSTQGPSLAHPHPRWTFHFTRPPAPGSTRRKFFSALTASDCARIFRSIVDLQAAINRYPQ